MKKKVLMLLTLCTVASCACTAIFVANSNNFESSFNRVNGVSGATVVFDGSHKTAYTQFGNPITSNANSSGTYLHVFTTKSNWNNTTSIQKITGFRFTYYLTDLGALNKMHVELRSSLNSGVLWSSTEIITQLGSGTKTYSINFNYDNAHYVFICVEPFDTSTPVSIQQAVITYTCQ